MTFYISKEISDKLKKEDSKSGLVNFLLVKHYGISDIPAIVEPEKSYVKFDSSSTCKNGHIAIRGDRCGEKGCKYNAYR